MAASYGAAEQTPTMAILVVALERLFLFFPPKFTVSILVNYRFSFVKYCYFLDNYCLSKIVLVTL